MYTEFYTLKYVHIVVDNIVNCLFYLVSAVMKFLILSLI